MKKNHRVVIPLLVFTAAVLGSVFTQSGIEWYQTLVKPSLTPPDAVFGPAWTLIYVLGALSAITFWDHFDMANMRHWVIKGLFRLNLVMNAFWSFLFFSERQIAIAFIEMNLLNASTLALIVLLWPLSRKASLMLVPYFLWVSFASYLTYEIWVLNP